MLGSRNIFDPNPMHNHLFRLIVSTVLLFGAVTPVLAQDASDMFVRMQRLEGQVRQLSGQIEQLQHQNRRLEDELQKFRKDTDLRFEDIGGAKGASASPPAGPKPAGKRNDAFDPNANPAAPGAPRALGSTPPSAPLTPGRRTDAAGAMPVQTDAPPATGSTQPQRIGPSVAVSNSGSAKADYDAAMEMMKRGEYASAEMAFRQFLQAHPKSGLVPEATFQLGESYNQRSQYREAAEQYLKVSTTWPQSTRAATAMLRLGVALQALGAKEQACSTLREVDRRYPNASASVKRGVERELQRARCEA